MLTSQGSAAAAPVRSTTSVLYSNTDRLKRPRDASEDDPESLLHPPRAKKERAMPSQGENQPPGENLKPEVVEPRPRSGNLLVVVMSSDGSNC